jgi:hypothetical protein
MGRMAYRASERSLPPSTLASRAEAGGAPAGPTSRGRRRLHRSRPGRQHLSSTGDRASARPAETQGLSREEGNRPPTPIAASHAPGARRGRPSVDGVEPRPSLLLPPAWTAVPPSGKPVSWALTARWLGRYSATSSSFLRRSWSLLRGVGAGRERPRPRGAKRAHPAPARTGVGREATAKGDWLVTPAGFLPSCATIPDRIPEIEPAPTP